MRPPLTEAERSRIEAAMRADRLARDGKPPPYDEDRVARSVVWTQYMAGIDARPFLKTREPIVFPEERDAVKVTPRG